MSPKFLASLGIISLTCLINFARQHNPRTDGYAVLLAQRQESGRVFVFLQVIAVRVACRGGGRSCNGRGRGGKESNLVTSIEN